MKPVQLDVLPLTFQESKHLPALTYLWPMMVYTKHNTFKAPTLCLISTLSSKPLARPSLAAPLLTRKRKRLEEEDATSLKKRRVVSHCWPVVAWVPLPHQQAFKKFKETSVFELTMVGKEVLHSVGATLFCKTTRFPLSSQQVPRVSSQDNNKIKMTESEKVESKRSKQLVEPASLLSITYCWPLMAWEPKNQPNTSHQTIKTIERWDSYKRKGEHLESGTKRPKFTANLALTYCWPIMPWVVPKVLEIPSEKAESVLIVQKSQPANSEKVRPVVELLVSSSLQLPKLPMCKQSNVSGNKEKRKGRDFEKESKRPRFSSTLSITYCWPVLPWVAPMETKLALGVQPKNATTLSSVFPDANQPLKVKVDKKELNRKRQGDELQGESKRPRFLANKAITYCWPILPWTAPQLLTSQEKGCEEETKKTDLIIKKSLPAPQPSTTTSPLHHPSITLFLPQNYNLTASSMKMLEMEELKELVNKKLKKSPLLRLTYCWPIIPFAKASPHRSPLSPSSIPSSESSNSFPSSESPDSIQSLGSKRGFSEVAGDLSGGESRKPTNYKVQQQINTNQ